MRLLIWMWMGCGEPALVQEKAPDAARVEPPPPAVPEPAPDAPPVERVAVVKKVVGHTDRYTFLQMDACGQLADVAGPRVEVDEGQALVLRGGSAFVDFESKQLGRTFDALLLVDAWKAADAPPACGATTPAKEMPPMRFGKILEYYAPDSYAFMRLEVCGDEMWVAGPARPGLAVGGLIATDIGNENKKFRSQALGRTFDSIWFVNDVKRAKSRPPCR